MKNCILFIIFLLTSQVALSGVFTWTGQVDTNYTTAGNWTGSSGIPGSNDTIYINSTTNRPVLTQNQEVYFIKMTSGSQIDLKTWSLTVQGYAEMTAGTMTGGTFVIRGTRAIFSGTTFYTTLDIIAGVIELSGGTFHEPCYFEWNGNTISQGSGGCVFNDDVTLVQDATRTELHLASASGDEFNGDLRIYLTNDSPIYLSDNDTTYYNGNVYLNNTGTSSVIFGDHNGVSYLASGKVIAVGDSGYAVNDLYLTKFIQLGSTEQSLTFTGSANVFLSGCIFNGAISLSAPGILSSSGTFNNTVSITKTGSGANYWYGSNKFNDETTISNIGSGSATDVLRLSGTKGNNFLSNVTFVSAGKTIQVDYADTSNFYGNISIDNSAIVFENCIALRGTSPQYLTGTTNYVFNKLLLNKTSNHAQVDTVVKVKINLNLTQGNLVTSSSNYLQLDTGSTVTNASNASFIQGAIRKLGNTAFEFPLGSDSLYRPLTITAPSSITDEFLAAYYGGSQNVGDSLDTVLTSVSYCNYWHFDRISGTSNVNMTLPWDTSFCALYDTTNMRIAKWDSTKWVDKGHGTITGNSSVGIMTLNSVANFGYFALGTTAIQATCSNNFTYYWNNTDAQTEFPSTNTLILSPSQIVKISGTFTINKDFTISGGQIFMDDDARILINSTRHLTLSKTRLRPCNNYQWDYIKIDGSTAKLTVRLTHIIGADTAIWSSAGGVFDIRNATYINKCYKGIMIDNYASAHTGYIENAWIGCATTPNGSTTV